MTSELLLRGGLVVDGSGGPGRLTDVRVSGGRIAEIGDGLRADGAEIIDLDGLCLAPGFIDIHTHFDAQVLWDPTLSPSSWHGVTSVVMGNCGFGIAPARPKDRATLVATLQEVEGMSAEALDAGIRWDFETYEDYLSLLERNGVQINVSAFIGHTPVRIYVMGDDAWDRPASGDEIRAMREVIAAGLRAGARGFSTSTSGNHVGAGGRPVPSRLASREELLGLADALGETERGVFQAPVGVGFFLDEFAEVSLRTGRPVTWLGPVTGMDYEARMQGRTAGSSSDTRSATLGIVDKSTSRGGDVWPQIGARPVVVQIDLRRPMALASLPAFADVMHTPEGARADVYQDAAWRERARPEFNRAWGHRWPKITLVETRGHPDLWGCRIPDLAEARGVDPFDLMLDLALADDLATRYQVVMANDDEEVLGELLHDRRTILGLSDAGAHGSDLCDAIYPTYLLAHWVREKQALTLEEAIWRLTSQPAGLFGFSDRGQIQRGFVADLVAFDAETVAPRALERVFDLPGGADRLVAESVGVEHMWVGGVAIRTDGKALPGPRPGSVIRSW